MDDRITVTMCEGVADVRLVRTDKMNALDDKMFSALIEAGERLKADAAVRAVVLSGEGRAFCAGLDTGNFAAMAAGERSGGQSSAGGSLIDPDRTPGGSNRAQHAVMVWREVPVPVIAAVHGVAFGGGFQLTLSADLRFVAADTRLSVMEIRWGLVRDDVARDLTFSGRQFSGEEALALGLATRVCADPRADALAYAAEIAGKSPHAIRGGKRLLNQSRQMDQHALLQLETDEQVALIGSPNQIEAVTSNMQKRAPAFADVA